MKFVITKILVVISLATLAIAARSADDDDDEWPGGKVVVTEEPTTPAPPPIKKYEGLDYRGNITARGEFPWIVALFEKKSQPPAYFCGGTLISATFVLSSAQCIQQKKSEDDDEVKAPLQANDIIAVFNAYDLKNALTDDAALKLTPKNVIVHEDWKPEIEDYDADLALLEFEKGQIVFNDHIKPVYLWMPKIELKKLPHGVVVGWTKIDDLNAVNKPRKLTLPIQTNEECFLTTKALIYLSSRRTFCAGFRHFSIRNVLGLGVCNGDRGSGIVIEQNGEIYLKGVMSVTTDDKEFKCNVERNAIYSNLFRIGDWIVNKTQIPVEAFGPPAPPVPEVQEVECAFATFSSRSRRYPACVVETAVDNEEIILGGARERNIPLLIVKNNKKVKFVPKQISEQLPNLQVVEFINCSLTIVRDYNFKSMINLITLDLSENKIAKIESGAFKDLAALKVLQLRFNRIETLDESLLSNLKNLESINLSDNRIKVLRPETFNINRGNLYDVYLKGNVCIRKNYLDGNLMALKRDIAARCRLQVEAPYDDRDQQHRSDNRASIPVVPDHLSSRFGPGTHEQDPYGSWSRPSYSSDGPANKWNGNRRAGW